MICGLTNKVNNPYADILNRKAGSASNNNSVRSKLLQMTNERRSVYDGFSSSQKGDLLINSMLDYGKSIRSERQQKKDSLISLKTLKYQFKSISSKLMSAKTSTSARMVVGQAEREVLRLKREKMKENVDETEIDAAINHAKAMERVARRKVKHLLQEELAKASGKCSMPEEKETDDIKSDSAGNERSNNEDICESEECSDVIDKINAETAKLSEEMLDTISEAMNDLMEEFGFEEAPESDPEDIKMMIIKHRNREMKEIAKADSEYLKAVFDHLEEMKSGAAPVMGTADMTGFATSTDLGSIGFNEPTIDVAL